MKKFTLLLMPVMPGFDAWAVNGFIEHSDESDESKTNPAPVPSESLSVLVDGFTTPAGETVFVEYIKLGNVIRTLREKSMGMSIQPLDRGGLLVSCEPNSALWTRILTTVNVPLNKLSVPVSKSK